MENAGCTPDAERRELLAEVSDEDLMTRFRSSLREGVFEELVRRYAGRAYRTALAVLGTRDGVEDAVQECFLRVIRACAFYRPGMSFSHWFFTILRNVCTDELRRRVRTPVRCGPVPEPVSAADSLSELAVDEEKQAVLRAFSGLSQLDREILALRVRAGLRFAEVASICGGSTEAAKKRAYRALDHLRRELAPHRQYLLSP